MKTYKILLLLIIAMLSFNSCDYLDIVPDEREKDEDAFKDVLSLQRYLYSCYAYIPNPSEGTNSLDFFTGDEVITPFEWEKFSFFPKGNYTAANPIISYWNTLFAGIRQCYMLQENIDKVPDITDDIKADYIAQTNFLIGYYHLLLIRCYGPTIIVDKLPDINTLPSDYKARSSIKECIEFVTNKLYEASKVLPPRREIENEVGLATSVAALSLRAYMYMYYASPLWNGGRICKQLSEKLINNDGTILVDPTEDRQRWAIARDAYKEAIDAALAAGHDLYKVENPQMNNPYPENPTLRVLRANLITIIKFNKEEIWTMAFDEGLYGLQKKSMPYVADHCYNGICPTMNMLDRFYTKDGLPMSVDPNTKNLDKYAVVSLNNQNTRINFADGTQAVIAEAGEQTSQMNLGREPRYYAWVSFESGFYELTNASLNGGYKYDPSVQKYNNKRMVTSFLSEGNCGRQGRDGAYSQGGFLNKKGVHPDNTATKSGINPLKKYPWPVIRLAELYLGYAECCAEVGTATDIANAKTYLNKVRERAGIPDVDTSWSKAGGVQSAKHLRDIVRQERQIELYLENQNFWDMRRWELADQYFNQKHKGLNISSDEMASFSVETEIPFLRSFQDYNWLLPIPAADRNNNHNLIQNPGY